MSIKVSSFDVKIHRNVVYSVITPTEVYLSNTGVNVSFKTTIQVV